MSTQKFVLVGRYQFVICPPKADPSPEANPPLVEPPADNL